ncbi:Thiosulfate sulfurtransferase GlpE [bacterium HR20]|nr:Thiosulfate sulfurtransferase GlpE [bacterium HR20]
MHRVIGVIVVLGIVGTLSLAQVQDATVSPPSQEKSQADPRVIYHFPVAESLPESAFLPDEIAQMMAFDTAIVIVDLRTPDEFATGHIRGSVNIPAEQVRKRLKEFVSMQKRRRNMILVSRDGTDARRVVKRLQREKIDRVWYMYGGIEAWAKSGHPLSKD